MAGTEYTVEFAERLAEKLKTMPPPPENKARKLNKQELVSKLADVIAEKQRDGWSIEQIADSLKGEGFEITTPTLKSYLQRVKARGPKARRKAQPRTRQGAHAGAAEGKTAAAPSAALAAKMEAAEKASQETKGGKSEFLAQDRKKL